MEYIDGVGDKLYVVFWHYSANYSEPDIVSADNPRQAFERKFPFYINTKNVDFHRYAIEITDKSKFVEIVNV
jgi:hypothetical protein